MATVTIAGLNALQARLQSFTDTLNDALAAKSQGLAQALADKVKDDKLGGQVLQTRSGRLKDSITSSVDQDDDGVAGNVFVSGDVPYAAIQEYGGTTKAHIIEAVNAKALAFDWHGKTAFFEHVNHPGSAIPSRSYLRSALNDSQDDILSGFEGALGEAIDNF